MDRPTDQQTDRQSDLQSRIARKRKRNKEKTVKQGKETDHLMPLGNWFSFFLTLPLQLTKLLTDALTNGPDQVTDKVLDSCIFFFSLQDPKIHRANISPLKSQVQNGTIILILKLIKSDIKDQSTTLPVQNLWEKNRETLQLCNTELARLTQIDES